MPFDVHVSNGHSYCRKRREMNKHLLCLLFRVLDNNSLLFLNSLQGIGAMLNDTGQRLRIANVATPHSIFI